MASSFIPGFHLLDITYPYSLYWTGDFHISPHSAHQVWAAIHFVPVDFNFFQDPINIYCSRVLAGLICNLPASVARVGEMSSSLFPTLFSGLFFTTRLKDMLIYIKGLKRELIHLEHCVHLPVPSREHSILYCDKARQCKGASILYTCTGHFRFNLNPFELFPFRSFPHFLLINPCLFCILWEKKVLALYKEDPLPHT